MDIQTLREQRSSAASAARQLLDSIEPEHWNDDHNQRYDAIVAEIGRIDDQLERLEEQLKIEAADHAITRQRSEREGVSDDEAHHNIAMEKTIFSCFLRGGIDALDVDQRQYVEQRRLRADLSTGTDTAGGYLVPTDFATRLIEEMKLFGNMRLVATIQQTDSGVPIEWPVADNLDQEGEIVAENTAVTDEDPTFGIKTIGAWKYSSKGVAVPFELLQDSRIDIEAYVVRLLAQRISRITNRHFTLGTGIGQPDGIVPSATKGATAATAVTIGFDDLINLEHSVDPIYRMNAQFMFADQALKTIKMLKDKEGRPLWIPGIAVSEPDTILGYSYVINQYMAAPAANAKSVLFGQLANYLIRDVMSVTLFRMTDSVYTRKGQVGFLAFSRHDGALLDASGQSVKYLQHAAAMKAKV
ncbi:phage major capsid protein [Endozoicomonas sp. ONNA2]|uniref:phage major capsid protein n=1 Tax=Endozoicomonas sp. ONNA2 TaxID=2828741 RepID=UPI0021489DE7|nr:phage major capsid protein [Endozoicomonas sp. ONNA2]